MRTILILCIMLGLSACGTEAADGSAQHDFHEWLVNFKQEARAQGISDTVLKDAFSDIEEPSEEILEHDKTQPEKTKSFPDYLKAVVTEKKIAAAQEEWQEHQVLLAQIEENYGVPAPILLALWGIESNFGARQGSYSIIESLTTLAYDGRRSQFFRGELLNALQVMQEEHIAAKDLTGSWAGAMGQVQFMPSSFLKFAVDFDGDGKKDIWENDADALASMANYLHQQGWKPEIGWGIKVRLRKKVKDWKGDQPLKVWQKLVVRANGKPLPKNMPVAHLVLPDNDPDSAYLVFSNYNVLMDWNRSTYFATAVGALADAIAK